MVAFHPRKAAISRHNAFSTIAKCREIGSMMRLVILIRAISLAIFSRNWSPLRICRQIANGQLSTGNFRFPFFFFIALLSVQSTLAQIPVLDWVKTTRTSGGASTEVGKGSSLTVDAAGNIYATSTFFGTVDFDPGAGVFNLTSAGSYDVFVTKLDPTGNFVWAKAVGGTLGEAAYGIAIDATGNIYVTGSYNGTADFDPGTSNFNLTSAGQTDIFIFKLDNDGNFVWAKSIGGDQYSSTGGDQGNGIATDAAGNVFVTGFFHDKVDFDPGPGVFNLQISSGSCPSCTMIFLLKLDTNGNFVWAKETGGGGDSMGFAVAIDPSGNVLTTGYFWSGAFGATSTGTQDIFIAKHDNNGNLLWGRAIGDATDISQHEKGYGIASDASGNVLVTGRYQNTTDFDPGAGVFNLTAVNSWDAFILKLNSSGGFVWAKSIGGTSTGLLHDAGYAITADATGNVYTTGSFYGTVDFDPGAGVYNLPDIGLADIFISKLDASGNFVWAGSMGGGSGQDIGNSIFVKGTDNIYTAGGYTGGSAGNPFDFDPNFCTDSYVGPGGFFVHKTKPGTLPPGPTITSFTPTSGLVGSTVTLTGTNFSTTPTNNVVKFYANRTATVSASTTTSLTVTVPASAATGPISVTTNCITATSTDFTVLTAPVPTITSFAPTSGPIGTTVTITGTNFNTTPANNTVKFNGTTATVTASTATSITTTVPSGATTGKITVTVGGNTATSATNFTVTGSSLPTITSFTPTSGNVGTSVTITGTNFSATPASNLVKFNGTTAVVTASTTTSITTSVPPGATTGKITVRVSGNTATSATNFTVTGSSLPTITNFTPTSGPIGTTVTINGTNFDAEPPGYDSGGGPYIPDNTVKFNGVTATVFSSSYTQLIVEVPPGATTGKISVTVGANTALSATNFVVTNSSPSITSFTPLSGPVGTVVTINGANFDPIENNNIVSFNGVDGYVYGSTTTSITVEVPAGADTGPITVNVGGNIATSSVPFTVITCTAPRTNGDLDVSFDPLVEDAVAFTSIELQSTGKSIVAAPSVTINGSVVQGLLRFNTNGTLDGTFTSANIDPYGKQMLIQPDDKIVAINNSGTDTFLERYNADGTKDPSFTTLTYSLSVTYPNYFGNIALQSDGKILYSLYSSFNGLDQLQRLNADGTPDATFNGPTGLSITVIKPLPDGRILIGTDVPGIRRLDSSGNIDSSFDPGTGTDSSVTDIAVQSNGKILISGYFTSVNGASRKGIARLDMNGALDATFNPGIGVDSGIEIMKFLSNNQIVIGSGFSRYDIGTRISLAKINADGSLDCAFDPGASIDGSLYDFAIQSDGKILLAGEYTTYDGTGRYAFARVNNLLNAPVITVNVQPSDVAICSGGTATFATGASGTTNITYQWQYSTAIVPYVFSDVTNGPNYSGVTTNTLTVNTAIAGRYRCKITGDNAATIYSSDAGLIVNAVAAPVTTGASGCGPATFVLNASGGTDGQFRWYSTPSGGTAISGQFNSTFNTTSLSATTTYYVSIVNGSCESARSAVTATILTTGCVNQPPVINSASTSTIVGGTASFSLVELLSDPDGNLDLNTLRIVTQPRSGATASIDGSKNLRIDYTGTKFAGTDALTIEVCDLAVSCVQKELNIEVSGDIAVYNALSPNGNNPVFYIQNIDALPETKANTVIIFDRWQNEVWRGSNYDNNTIVFKGVSADGADLPTGIYFYRLDFESGKKTQTGFISLKR